MGYASKAHCYDILLDHQKIDIFFGILFSVYHCFDVEKWLHLCYNPLLGAISINLSISVVGCHFYMELCS